MRILFLGILFFVTHLTFAQSNYKESSNNFALYSKTGDLKSLENAKKFIDASYKTRRDSTSSKVNILRAMIYSTIAYADSTNTIKSDIDPLDATYRALEKLNTREQGNNAAEVKYVKQNLAAAHLYRANKALLKKDYSIAYDNYTKVKNLALNNYDVVYNLALLAVESEKYGVAIEYYRQLLSRPNATADQYLELAEVYKKTDNPQEILNTLNSARSKFPTNKTILMHLIQVYAQDQNYAAIAPIIDEAIKFEPENIELNYLAGYAHEAVGNAAVAKTYYQQVLKLNQNNYEANLALGLLYLQSFLNDEDDIEAEYYAQNLLLKANEIRPYDVNTLKSLSLYYEKTEDLAQLDRVKLLLNQLSNN